MLWLTRAGYARFAVDRYDCCLLRRLGWKLLIASLYLDLTLFSQESCY